MSVIKSKRGIAYTSFCDNARKIVLQTIKVCEIIPKRHYDYLQKPISDAAVTLYDYTIQILSSIQMEKDNQTTFNNEVFNEDLYRMYLKSCQINKTLKAFGSLVLELNSDLINKDMVKEWFDMINLEEKYLDVLFNLIFEISN